jgi:hypothetical protein
VTVVPWNDKLISFFKCQLSAIISGATQSPNMMEIVMGDHKKSRSSELWRRVVLWKDASVSEVHDGSASPWRWRQQGPPKRWYLTITLHGVTTQKTSTWVFIAVKVSSLAPNNKILNFVWLHEQKPYFAVNIDFPCASQYCVAATNFITKCTECSWIHLSWD